MIFASLTLQRDAWHYICYMALLHWRCRCRVVWVFHCSVPRAFRCRCFFLLKLKLQQQTSTSSITEFRACLSPRMHKSKRPIQFPEDRAKGCLCLRKCFCTNCQNRPPRNAITCPSRWTFHESESGAWRRAKAKRPAWSNWIWCQYSISQL